MPARHVLLAAAVAVVWGVNFVVIHVGLGDFPPLLFAALRFTLVALPRGPVRAPAGRAAALGARRRRVHCAGQFALLFVGDGPGLPAGLASLVLQVQVLFTIALAVVLLGERPRPRAARRRAGRARRHRGDRRRPRRRRAARRARAERRRRGVVGRRATSARASAQAPRRRSRCWCGRASSRRCRSLALSLGAGRGRAVDRRRAACSRCSTSSCGSTFFGFGSWAWLMRRHPASRVVPFTLLVPAVGIATAWVALGEQPNAAELIGAARGPRRPRDHDVRSDHVVAAGYVAGMAAIAERTNDELSALTRLTLDELGGAVAGIGRIHKAIADRAFGASVPGTGHAGPRDPRRGRAQRLRRAARSAPPSLGRTAELAVGAARADLRRAAGRRRCSRRSTG